MAEKTPIVKEYARMWPREVCYQLGPNASGKGKNVLLVKGLELVNEPGVYVLYRDGIPYYLGQATRLRHRLWAQTHVHPLLDTTTFGITFPPSSFKNKI